MSREKLHQPTDCVQLTLSRFKEDFPLSALKENEQGEGSDDAGHRCHLTAVGQGFPGSLFSVVLLFWERKLNCVWH